MSELRSASFGSIARGSRPSSRVRVYERRGIDGFFVTQAWITTASGRPQEVKLPEHLTWEQAKATAELLAAQRKADLLDGSTRIAVEREAREPVTLATLFRQYLASETAAGWSEKHRKDVTRSLEFWQLALSPDRNVLSLNADVVERTAGGAGRDRTASPRWVRKRLKHLRAAVRWGKRKAGLYGRDPLEAVDLPDYHPDTDDLIYSATETRTLWTPHEDVDWRVTLLVNITADTGRRLSAMLALRTEDVRTDGTRPLLRFRREYDKGGRGALVPVSAPTAALLADTMERDIVAEWGWLFPEGRLDYDDCRDKPWGYSAAIHALHDAERVLGVRYVPGRAYHGVKRRHVTTSWELTSGDTGLIGDLTGNASAEVLRRIYRKASQGRMGHHVDRVREELAGTDGGPKRTA